jgi:integrase/recombinase XerC
VLRRIAETTGRILMVTARPEPGPIEGWMNQLLDGQHHRARIVATGSFEAKTDVLLENGIKWFVEDRLETCHLLKAAGIEPMSFSDSPGTRNPMITFRWDHGRSSNSGSLSHDAAHAHRTDRSFSAGAGCGKGYSAHTIRAYGHDLAEFAGYAAGTAWERPQKAQRPLAIDEIDSLTVRGYLGRLHRKNEKITIARKLSALRSFFRHLVKHRLTDEDPTAAILTPKHSRRMPSYLSVDDMFRLLDQTTDDTVLGLRNRALFETLYGSGIRVSELTGLNVFDVDVFSGCLRVSGKGNRQRIVPVGEKALDRIQAYRDRLLGPDRHRHGRLTARCFLNKNKGRLSNRAPWPGFWKH